MENVNNASDNNPRSNPPRRTLGDNAMYQSPRHYPSIMIPHTARTVEIKLAYLNLVSVHQFMGKNYEDLYAHLDNFYELVVTMRLTNWSDLETKLLTNFSPPARYVHAKFEISTFRQGVEEAFYEAWERFQMLLRKCPNHEFEDADQLNIFCNGLKPETKMLLDVAAGGTMMVMDAEQATRIITALSATYWQTQHNRRTLQKRGVLDLNTSDAILAQNKILTQQIEALTKQMSKLPQQLNVVQTPSVHQQVLHYEFCGGDHVTGHCSMPTNIQAEEVQYVNNQPRQANLSNNPSFNNLFSQGWRGNQNENHNFGWRQDVGPSNRNLETRVGQLAKQMTEQNSDRQQFSANTQTKLKDTANLSLLDVVIRKTHKGDAVQDEEGVVTNEDDKRENNDKRKGDLPQLKDLPYPKRHSKKDKERHNARFLDIFKNLHINIPFMEAMEQMHVYAKFMKNLLTKKRKFSEETMTLEAGRNAIIQNSLFEKTKDPDNFTIPVTIGELSVGKTLLDLGANINLMPLSMLKRIRNLEIKPTRMTLQLANRSVKYPYGVAEDVLVKVDGLVFPVNFVIMDIEEDKEHPRDNQHCFQVDVIEDLFMLNDIHLSRSSPLEKVLRGDLEGNSMEKLLIL
ncbi:PREDICTED: uncharacterized protein LOC109352889 [Lupinus angustifolius]|uniref:uncharacterized protein LOC109352889 n=1 Tax=Lupinus angustifolius TaxID=3871 RepID=UPI00092FB46F|nr:PREDICTED: uncharacterized protein LOC109352889 [Lupinus angustifolius]